ncbi:hypothetical protein AB3S75_024507 [Citrus x aurantiifolia]
MCFVFKTISDAGFIVGGTACFPLVDGLYFVELSFIKSNHDEQATSGHVLLEVVDVVFIACFCFTRGTQDPM